MQGDAEIRVPTQGGPSCCRPGVLKRLKKHKRGALVSDISERISSKLLKPTGLTLAGKSVPESAATNADGPTSLKTIDPWRIIGLCTTTRVNRRNGWMKVHDYHE
jgi:hypothetical protein